MRTAALAFFMIITMCLGVALAQDAAPAPAPGSAPAPGTAPAAPAAPVDPNLQTLEQQASYALGYNIGRNFADDLFAIDMTQLTRGFTDAMKSATPAMTDDQLKAALGQLQKEMYLRVSAKTEAVSAKFLADNAKREGVKTTDTGLQYEVITEGTGAKPKATDTVTVNYRGTLPTGEEFDSSYKRGQPATFPLNRVIPGWTEGLQLMTEGAKYKLYVPSKLGYGPRGTPDGSIGPNQVLVFEVELIKVGEPAEEPMPVE